MRALTTGSSALQARQGITEAAYQRYVNYLDASPRTVEAYSRALRHYLEYIAEKGITHPTRETVIEYRDDLKASHKPSTVQNYITAVRLFFRWTEQEGVYPNIAEHIKGAKISKDHKKDYLTSDQVRSVMAGIDRSTAQGRRDMAIFALMVTGGLRDIEVSRANIEDLRTVGDSTALYLQGKGKEERTDYVLIPAEVEAFIRASLADRKNAAGNDPLFTSMSNNSMGKRISTRSVSGTIKKYLRAAGFDSDRLTAHSLRHTAVTLSVLGGNSLEEVKQFARHSNINTTMIYFHEQDRKANRCSRTVASAIF
jgi:integrase/recombinase XerC